MRESFGLFRLHALPAPDVWRARTGLTLHAVVPHSTVTVAVNVAGLLPGDIAGLALFRRPYAWLGMERVGDVMAVAQFDQRRGRTTRIPLSQQRVWFRAECDFSRGQAFFGYSTDGSAYVAIGEPYEFDAGPRPTGGIPCALFSCATTLPAGGGLAEFDSFMVVTELASHEGAGREP